MFPSAQEGVKEPTATESPVHIDLADDAPAWKPAPASYNYAASRCSLPAQMLLVAVHPWDILPLTSTPTSRTFPAIFRP